MAGKADLAARRKTVRRGRERGCWLYIPKEALDECGYTGDIVPWAVISPGRSERRRRMVVTLYTEA